MSTTLEQPRATKGAIPTLVLNFDDDADKRKLYGVLKTLRGKWRVELTRFKPRRSDRQNRYYWGLCIPYVQQVLRETQGDDYDPEQAHEFAKAMFLSRPMVDKRTGELLTTVVGSSAVLSTEQFTDYVEHLRQWCAEFGGVVIPDPNEMVMP